MSINTITEFTGNYRFLSNFWPGLVLLDGRQYYSVEAAYQASKTNDLALRVPFEQYSPVEAKRAGKYLTLRPDWESVKLDVMLGLLKQKFAPGSKLYDDLLQTKPLHIQEGNYWGDKYWGVCLKTGTGENHLGRLLMQLRDTPPT